MEFEVARKYQTLKGKSGGRITIGLETHASSWKFKQSCSRSSTIISSLWPEYVFARNPVWGWVGNFPKGQVELTRFILENALTPSIKVLLEYSSKEFHSSSSHHITIVQPGFNLIKLLHLYFTSVAILFRSLENNSHTCKSLIKLALYRAKACSSQAICFQQLVCDSQLQYNTVNFSPMCSLYGGQRIKHLL